MRSIFGLFIFAGITSSSVLGQNQGVNQNNQLIHNANDGDNKKDDTLSKLLNKALKNGNKKGRYTDDLQRIQSIKTVLEVINSVNNDVTIETEIKTNMQTQLEKLRDELLKEQSSMGQFWASAIAPSYKDLSHATITTWQDGVLAGIGQRITRDIADVFSKHIKNGADRAIGTAFDFAVQKASIIWFQMNCVLFHGGHQPFDLRIINGWHELTQTTFEDVGSLVKEGIRHGMRNLDMTSRQQEADPSEETDTDTTLNAQPTTKPTAEEEKIKKIIVWNLLINGYIRQFRYIASQIEWYSKYYSPEHPVVFYGSEICSRLNEVAKVLEETQTLKGLNEAAESNAAFISAIKNNVSNLFKQLKQACEPLSEKSSSSSSSSGSISKKDKSSLLGSDFDTD